jgi:hypothetical protein
MPEPVYYPRKTITNIPSSASTQSQPSNTTPAPPVQASSQSPKSYDQPHEQSGADFPAPPEWPATQFRPKRTWSRAKALGRIVGLIILVGLSICVEGPRLLASILHAFRAPPKPECTCRCVCVTPPFCTGDGPPPTPRPQPEATSETNPGQVPLPPFATPLPHYEDPESRPPSASAPELPDPIGWAILRGASLVGPCLYTVGAIVQQGIGFLRAENFATVQQE